MSVTTSAYATKARPGGAMGRDFAQSSGADDSLIVMATRSQRVIADQPSWLFFCTRKAYNKISSIRKENAVEGPVNYAAGRQSGTFSNLTYLDLARPPVFCHQTILDPGPLI
jgi:hypothetical protein